MAVGDMYLNGEKPTDSPDTCKAMCERVVAAGLWFSTPESLFERMGMPSIFWMYWRALAGEGGKIEMEVDNGRRIVMWEGK